MAKYVRPTRIIYTENIISLLRGDFEANSFDVGCSEDYNGTCFDFERHSFVFIHTWYDNGLLGRN